ncbi:MAG: LysR substrate-binding domain-containing protein [Candidatus Promineifilaceae bacterium]
MPLAREMVERSVTIVETMKSLEGEVHGQLLVGCSTTPGKYILPQLLASFHQEYPLVRVACNVMAQSNAFDMLCEGDLHVALVSEPYVSSQAFVARRFINDPVILIAPLDHPWALRDEIEPDELLNGEFISREQGSGTEATVRSALEAMDISTDELDTLLVLGSAEAIALSVKEGIGVGFVSQIVYSKLVPDQVAAIAVRGLNISREIHIAAQNRKAATLAQTAFWNFMMSEMLQQKINEDMGPRQSS